MQFRTSLLKNVGIPEVRDTVALPQGRLRVGILGTGKIGTDLLIKVQRSAGLECVIFSGRNLQSVGMQFAVGLGVPVSDKGIHVFFDPACAVDIVFDATSAAHHMEHAQIFDQLGIFAIDLTPSQIGECCVPALGMSEVSENKNISMISCGGQSAIPIAQVFAQMIPGIEKFCLRSMVSPDSIGPGTLANIEEYYRNTRSGLSKYTAIHNVDIELVSDAQYQSKPMHNRLRVYAANINFVALKQALLEMEQQVQAYVPGYKLQSLVPIEGGAQVDLTVEGRGDYLPSYAGNLDIINCAAIAVAEHYANMRLAAQLRRSFDYSRMRSAMLEV